MLFHFLNLSQCVVCMFGHKKIYKSQSPLQRDVKEFTLFTLFNLALWFKLYFEFQL